MSDLYQKKEKFLFKNQINTLNSKVKGEQTRRTIGIVSGKGGVGKTVVTANLGLALNKLEGDVTVVDADITASNLGLHLGTYSFPVTLQDVLNRESRISKATYVTSTGFMVIPSSISVGSIHANVSKLKNTLKKLSGIVLVDSPPGLDKESLKTVSACNEIIVVATPDMPAMTNAMKTIQIAKKMKKDVLGIVVNRYNNDGYELSPDEIEILCGVPTLCKIPEDPEMRKSLFVRSPIINYNIYSKATIEFHKLAAKLLSKDYQPPNFLSMRRFLRRFKK